MHPNEEVLETFYSAFKAHDPEKMTACYGKNITFTDPAFGNIKGDRARAMWFMLIERGGSNLEISYSDIQANDYNGSAKWTATYLFGPKKRKVVNHVVGTFYFQNGKILQHTDHFNLWRWSRQAIGFKGLILGWSNVMKLKIQQQSSKSLSGYLQNMRSFKEETS
ncbi:nuclear transport factor 2 family protein [Leeuwenhoekiella sp. W20_SRS_FM14]|uniref:nuclear transport factor 2 family protein n=1 Tax=Leeuwenhoekiella sp. W20_SRS_FM14 TaxID=3240270 RepID=UPI003F94903F